MSTDENKQVMEQTDKEALRKVLTELEAKLDDLYARSDRLDKSIAESKEALEKVHKRRVNFYKARLQKMFAQWNMQQLNHHHHPPHLSQQAQIQLQAQIMAQLQSYNQSQNQSQNTPGGGVLFPPFPPIPTPPQ
ncbi:hypothetical protein F66182_6365 [Fusarium sp. NRRL 66182]|nr:hypothetical protein F66182_6365 [Fusarium sp. NRRL 66182]